MSSPAIQANEWEILKVRFNNNVEAGLGMNGWSTLDTNAPALATSGVLTLGGAGYGTSTGGCMFDGGYIAEVLMYGSALSDIEAFGVAKYLNQKYMQSPWISDYTFKKISRVANNFDQTIPR